MAKDEDESETNFEFASKYIKDNPNNNIKQNNKSIFPSRGTIGGSNKSTEVLGNIGQEEGYSKNPGNRDEDEDSIDILADKHSEKIEFEDKNRVNAIIEQDKNVDNESITLDTINSVNKDPKRK